MVKFQSVFSIADDNTHINRENPSTWTREMGKRSNSHPSSKLIIQIVRVLHISVRLRATELTCLVMLNPKKLNALMLHIIAIPLQSTLGV